MLYDVAKRKVLTEDLTEGLSVLLVTDAYAFDPAHQRVEDVEGDEFQDSSYSRKTVQNVGLKINSSSYDIKGDDLFWDVDLSGVVGGVVFYYPGFLLSFFDTEDKVLDGSGFRVQFDSEGVVGVDV